MISLSASDLISDFMHTFFSSPSSLISVSEADHLIVENAVIGDVGDGNRSTFVGLTSSDVGGVRSSNSTSSSSEGEVNGLSESGERSAIMVAKQRICNRFVVVAWSS